MASLFIKDPEVADRVARVAKRLGTTKTDVVRRGIAALEQALPPEDSAAEMRARLDAWRLAHPLPPPTGLKADKAFFDWLSGEEDADDPVR